MLSINKNSYSCPVKSDSDVSCYALADGSSSMNNRVFNSRFAEMRVITNIARSYKKKITFANCLILISNDGCFAMKDGGIHCSHCHKTVDPRLTEIYLTTDASSRHQFHESNCHSFKNNMEEVLNRRSFLQPIEEQASNYLPDNSLDSLRQSAASKHENTPDQHDFYDLNPSTSTGKNIITPLAMTQRSPEYAVYSFESNRRETFNEIGWPQKLYILRDSLAKAGFFYCSHADYVLCFECNGKLKNWKVTDDPWKIHARYFSKCAYLLKEKGSQFVKSIQSQEGITGIGKKKNSMARDTGASEPFLNENMSSLKFVQNLTVIDNTTNIDPEETAVKQINETALVSRSNTEIKQKLEKDNQLIKKQIQCKICLDKLANMVFLPCGHIASCENCLPFLTDEYCPICRRDYQCVMPFKRS